MEFRDYLQRAMQVRVELREEQPVSGWWSMRKAIVAGTRDQLTGCGDGLSGRKDYQIVTAPDRITVCGFDERGAMYGIYNLEARMNLREAPYLPAPTGHNPAKPVQGAHDSFGTRVGRMARSVSGDAVAIWIRFHLRLCVCEPQRRKRPSSVLGPDEEAGSRAGARPDPPRGSLRNRSVLSDRVCLQR